MARIRFKLSTLLWLLTLAALTTGLGFRIYELNQQVVKLEKELKSKKPTVVTVGGASAASATRNSPFQLLNTKTIVFPSVEQGMKAGELEHRQRIQQQNERDDIRAPKRDMPHLESWNRSTF